MERLLCPVPAAQPASAPPRLRKPWPVADSSLGPSHARGAQAPPGRRTQAAARERQREGLPTPQSSAAEPELIQMPTWRPGIPGYTHKDKRNGTGSAGLTRDRSLVGTTSTLRGRLREGGSGRRGGAGCARRGSLQSSVATRRERTERREEGRDGRRQPSWGRGWGKGPQILSLSSAFSQEQDITMATPWPPLSGHLCTQLGPGTEQAHRHPTRKEPQEDALRQAGRTSRERGKPTLAGPGTVAL